MFDKAKKKQCEFILTDSKRCAEIFSERPDATHEIEDKQMEYKVSIKQINQMKHALGFSNDRVKGRKYRKYQAYRNFYTSNIRCDGFKDLVKLTEQGLMICRQRGTQGYIFHVTSKGMEFLIRSN